jgi:hypothetical protein
VRLWLLVIVSLLLLLNWYLDQSICVLLVHAKLLALVIVSLRIPKLKEIRDTWSKDRTGDSIHLIHAVPSQVMAADSILHVHTFFEALLHHPPALVSLILWLVGLILLLLNVRILILLRTFQTNISKLVEQELLLSFIADVQSIGVFSVASLSLLICCD